MAKLALIFSVVLVLVVSIAVVESSPQYYFNLFDWLYQQGVNRSGQPAADGVNRSGRPAAAGGGGPRRSNRLRSRFATSGRTSGRSRSRSSDDGKGKYWNGYDKDGYGRNGRDVSHVLAAAAHTVLTSNSIEPKFMRR